MTTREAAFVEASQKMGDDFYGRVCHIAQRLGLSPQTVLIRILRLGLSQLELEEKSYKLGRHQRQVLVHARGDQS